VRYPRGIFNRAANTLHRARSTIVGDPDAPRLAAGTVNGVPGTVDGARNAVNRDSGTAAGAANAMDPVWKAIVFERNGAEEVAQFPEPRHNPACLSHFIPERRHFR